MERPEKISKDTLPYVEYLEKRLEKFLAKKTYNESYIALKKTIKDINDILINGMRIERPVLDDDGTPCGTETDIVPVVSSEALSSKDEKTFERLFKFIDNLGKYNDTLRDMEENIAPEDRSDEDYGSEYEEIISGIE
jgi:hypothetical protein